MSLRPALAALALLPPLAGCGGAAALVLGGLGSAASVYSVVDKVTQALDPYIAKACDEYQKRKAAADATVAAGVVAIAASVKIGSIESFGDAACAAPPAGDPLSTAIWLGELGGQLTTLTSGNRGG